MAVHFKVVYQWVATRFRQLVLEPVQYLAKGRIAALKLNSKCSHTSSMLRFFVQFCLALHPLIETLNRFLGLKQGNHHSGNRS